VAPESPKKLLPVPTAEVLRLQIKHLKRCRNRCLGLESSRAVLRPKNNRKMYLMRPRISKVLPTTRKTQAEILNAQRVGWKLLR
jgi:hypothetical protein